MINEQIENVLQQYKEEKNKSFSDNSLASLIRHTIPENLATSSNISNEYLVYGSSGKGNWAEVPWIGIFDKSITKSAQSGYYIVYLFDAELNRVYLSLNQGWTQFEKRYGRKIGLEKISEKAEELQKKLRSTLSDFTFNVMDLHAKNILGKGYERGHICGKYYIKDNIPDDKVIIDDLRNLLGVYRELKGLVGNNIFSEIGETTSENEEIYQEEANEVLPISIDIGPLPKPNPTQIGQQTVYRGKPGRAKNALINADHKCENDDKHSTFIHKKTKKPFMEAHHLVPLRFQNEFKVDIDVPENIISMCPNCHRLIHKAKDNEKSELLDRLFAIRRNSLAERGINISLERILKYYSVEKEK